MRCRADVAAAAADHAGLLNGRPAVPSAAAPLTHLASPPFTLPSCHTLLLPPPPAAFRADAKDKAKKRAEAGKKRKSSSAPAEAAAAAEAAEAEEQPAAEAMDAS